MREPHGGCTWWVLDPRSNSMIAYWDIVTSIALLFTAIVTPFEVGFLEPVSSDARWNNPLFLANRLIDCIFIADMCLQFRLAYSLGRGGGRHWEFDAGRIARHYVLSRWFLVDAFSIGTSAFDIVGDGNDAQSLSGLRAVRTLRLLKLVRLIRGSRVFKRWEMRLSINYAYLSIFSTTVSMLITSHWFACIWGAQATFDPINSWLRATEYCVPWPNETAYLELTFEAGEVLMAAGGCPADRVCAVGSGGGMACMPPAQMYSYSIYWSVATISSVGYGDITATPFNMPEQILATTMMMLVGGMIWSQLIGTFCGVAASLSPGVQEFRGTLSQLNAFMASMELPDLMRYKLREYMYEAVHLTHAERNNALLSRLSRKMQYEVSWHINSPWLSRVWYLVDSDGSKGEVLIELASKLKARVYPPGEPCAPGSMYIVSRGIALHNCKVHKPGMVWGEDVLLDDPKLQEMMPGLPMSYLWVMQLDAPTLLSVLEEHREAAKSIWHARRWWKFRRVLVHVARERIEAQRRASHDDRSSQNGLVRRSRLSMVFNPREMNLAVMRSQADSLAHPAGEEQKDGDLRAELRELRELREEMRSEAHAREERAEAELRELREALRSEAHAREERSQAELRELREEMRERLELMSKSIGDLALVITAQRARHDEGGGATDCRGGHGGAKGAKEDVVTGCPVGDEASVAASEATASRAALGRVVGSGRHAPAREGSVAIRL